MFQLSSHFFHEFALIALIFINSSMITLIIQPQPQGMAPAGINFVPTQPQELETLWKSKLLVFPWDNIPAHKSINTELSLQGLIPLHPRSPESPDQSLWTCSILPSLEQECHLIFKSCLWMRPETIPKPLVNIPQCPSGEQLSDPKALQAKFPPALSLWVQRGPSSGGCLRESSA